MHSLSPLIIDSSFNRLDEKKEKGQEFRSQTLSIQASRGGGHGR